MVNYLDNARKDEAVFRAILSRYNYDHEKQTLEDIFVDLSSGNRLGKFTVIDFEKKEKDKYEFVFSNAAAFAGLTITELYYCEEGNLKSVQTINVLMS